MHQIACTFFRIFRDPGPLFGAVTQNWAPYPPKSWLRACYDLKQIAIVIM